MRNILTTLMGFIVAFIVGTTQANEDGYRAPSAEDMKQTHLKWSPHLDKFEKHYDGDKRIRKDPNEDFDNSKRGKIVPNRSRRGL